MSHGMEPDEHLRAALRHAPDAGLAAPPDVGARILAAARRATAEQALPAATVAPRRGEHWFARFFGRGGSPAWRLGGSGALASVVLAGVIGLMWRGEPPPVQVEAPGGVGSSSRDEVRPAPSEEPALAASHPSPSSLPGAPTPTVGALPQQPVVPERTERLRRSLPAVPAAAVPALPSGQTAAAGAVADAMTTLPPLPKASLLPALSVTAPESTVAASLDRQASKSAAAPAAAPAPPPAVTGREAPVGGSTRSLAEAAPSAGGRALLQGLPGDVQWRLDGQLHGAPAGWLAQLQQATRAQGAWQAVPPGQGQARPGEREVRWSRGDEVLGRLWLGQGRVLWCTPAGHCEEAALPAPAARQLLLRLVPQ